MKNRSFIVILVALATLAVLVYVGCRDERPTLPQSPNLVSRFDNAAGASRPVIEPGKTNSQKIPEAPSALMTVDLNSQTVADVVAAMIGSGPNAPTISNITFNSNNAALGTFSGGSGIIGFDQGVVISSGAIASIVGPNVDDYTTTAWGLPGDPDLDALIPGYVTHDAAVLEFDFQCPTVDTISFQFVFASEEYNEYVNSQYNDVFGFFVNGVNIAHLPDGVTPVSVNNVNCGNPYNPPNGANCALYINNDLSDGGGSIDTEMDGLTVVLTATTVTNPGVNHFKLAIADAGDQVLDSNVFIRGESFLCGQQPECSVTPDTLNFDQVTVGSTKDLSFTITNIGEGTLTGTVGTGCGAFSVTSGSGSYALGHNVSKQVVVRFAPTTTGAQQCSLSLGSNYCTDLICTGTGYTPPAICSVTPSPLNFDQVTVGSTKDLSFTITNIGEGTLTGTVGTGCGAFSVTSGSGSYALGANVSKQVVVRFAPTTTGAQQCSLPLGSGLCDSLTCTGTGNPPPTLTAKLDIHPTSCPNPFNYTANGVLPAAILGTKDFDVKKIDVSSILLKGVAPLRWALEDVMKPVKEGAAPCECTTAGPDGYVDLTLKFDNQKIAAVLGPHLRGDVVTLTITFKLLDGSQFVAKDCVVVVKVK